MTRMTVYTIGHSNHAIDTFIALLRRHGIECLVDVRSMPYSRYSPHFNKESLEAHLRDEGIDYRFAGKQLGGRPNDDDLYHPDGSADYGRIAQREWYSEGIQTLIDIAKTQRTTIMCSEENPDVCHRHNLITQTLLAEDLADVLHIRGDVEQDPQPASLNPVQTKLF